MQPYYSQDGIVIYHADCREVLPTLEPVDLVLTDPPYGIAITRNSNRFGVASNRARRATNEAWDDAVPSPECFRLMLAASKHQIVFGANYFWEYFRSSPCYIVWDKRGELPHVPFAPTEFAWTSFDRMSRKYTVINHGFVSDVSEARQHPTQKPLRLFRAILSDFTGPADVILDPFMGSGTTLRAAKDLGLRAIGIEIEEKYCEIAAERLRQRSLFEVEAVGQ